MTPATMTTDDLAAAVFAGIYGGDRMAPETLSAALAAVDELVRRADDADRKRRQADAGVIRCAAGAITVSLGDGDAVDVFRRLHALADAIERGPGGAP